MHDTPDNIAIVNTAIKPEHVSIAALNWLKRNRRMKRKCTKPKQASKHKLPAY